jgi:hypothetical protein
MISFFGRNGGMGEIASAISATLTVGGRWKMSAAQAQMNGMITYIDNSERPSSPGFLKR